MADSDASQKEGGFFGCCGARGTGGKGSDDGDSSDENAQDEVSSDDEQDTNANGGRNADE